MRSRLEATARKGYFFRQYALVDNGTLIEKVLCERDSEIFIVVSQTPEPLHDFTRTLIDFGVDNAVYLVGSTSFGFYVIF